MKLFKVSAILPLFVVAIGTAQAQHDVIATADSADGNWAGFYIGANLGGAWNNTCDTWEPGAAITSGNYPGLANRFYNRDCPNNGHFIGGVDLGYNFQYNQWVWGLKVDYDAVESSSKSRSYTFAGAAGYPIPPGTYTASGKISPDGIILLGPRIGYAFDQWLPYFRFGGAFALGSHEAALSYVPPAVAGPLPVAAPTTLYANKDYKTNGWNVGLGLDYAISGPWSFTAEYNYVNLGHGDNSNVSCYTSRGTVPPICATYANFNLDNIHNSFTMNMFRVGFHYRF